MLHAQIVALALVATTFVASGCGGSSKAASTAVSTTVAQTSVSTTTTAPATTIKISSGRPLSRSTWIAKAETICGRTNTELDTIRIKTEQQFASLLPQAAAYDHAEATELSKLVPPTTMADDWRQIVTDFQKFGEYTQVVANYALADNLTGARSIYVKGKRTHEQATRIAKHDGFKECSLI